MELNVCLRRKSRTQT